MLAAVLLAVPGLRSAQREPVLRQIKVPHRYYYREMYLPQLTRMTVSALPLITLLLAAGGHSQPAPRPRLVVVIVIDQFRPEYLARFRPHFAKGGFNLFLERGADFAGARYQHGATLTCPGHAVVLTGSHADVNGIISNSWYDAKAERQVYCAADTSVSLIGASTEGRSPRQLIGLTVGDELKLATAGRSRIIAVAGKDRSAIMLGGHLADAAYWMADTLFVSSTYYLKQLPDWVRQFNASGAVTAYAGRSWDRLLSPSAYAALGPDDVGAEEDFAGMGRTFPHRLSTLGTAQSSFVQGFESSPYQNEVIAEFAMQAVLREGLGQDESPDLLAIGFSANDLVGHAYGPDSHEILDMTVRTDRQLDRLFGFLDKRIGLGNVVLVLTADHGVAPFPELLRRLNARAGAARFDPSSVAAAVDSALQARFGAARAPGWIAYQGMPMLYLNRRAVEEKRIPMEEVERVARAAVEGVPGVHQALTATELGVQRNNGVKSGASLSFFPARSGNIYYELLPYWVPGRAPVGTTHGSPWAYDTRVPLLWFGASIAPGVHHQAASIADVAPTLSALLGIAEPPTSQGRVLHEMFR